MSTHRAQHAAIDRSRSRSSRRGGGDGGNAHPAAAGGPARGGAPRPRARSAWPARAAAALVLAFAGLAGMLCLPAPAAAQTVHWTTTLTVADKNSNEWGYSTAGEQYGAYGSVGSATFDISGTTYTVARLATDSYGELLLHVKAGTPAATTALPGADSLVLQLENKASPGTYTDYALKDATYSATDTNSPGYEWDDGSSSSRSGMLTGQASGDTMTVRIISPSEAPSFDYAEVNGTSLVITFDKDLAAAANLANSAFTVKVGGTTVTLTGSPSISGKKVTLTLATAVAIGDTVTVSYTKPTAGTNNRLKDADDNETESFTDQSVDNITPSDDATLSALDVEHDGTALFFDHPTFASATRTYYLSVANAVDNLDIGPIPNHTGVDDIQFFDKNNVKLTLSEDDDLYRWNNLSEGANTIKVVVTAQDTTTTETYTIHVAREASAPTETCDDLWCANLTLGADVGLERFGYAREPTAASKIRGGLLPKTFMIGTNTYTLDDIVYEKNVSRVRVLFTSGIPDGSYVVQIGTTKFPATLNAAKDTLNGSGSTSGLSTSFGAVQSIRIIELSVPGAPTGLTATAVGSSRIDLSWNAPANDGNSDITGYRIEWSADGNAPWADLVANTGSTATAYSDTGLPSNTTRHYRVSAINGEGTGDPSNTDSATTDDVDEDAPTFSSAEVPAAGTHVYVTMNEALDLGSGKLPPASAFAVTVAGSDNNVTAVEVRTGVTDGLALRLADTVYSGQTVTVSYTDPSGGNDAAALQDATGNDAATFANQAVTNNSTEQVGVGVNYEHESFTFLEGGSANRVTLVAKTDEDVKPGYQFRMTLETNSAAPDGKTAATAQVDYEVFSKTVLFAPNDFVAENGIYVARKSELITVTDDTEIEATEYFELSLGKAPGTPSAVTACGSIPCKIFVTILDNDTPTTKPDKVTGVTLSPGEDEIRVSWNRAARATGYKVEWKSGGESYASSRRKTISGGGSTSTTITGLVVDTAYTVQVIATNDIGDGPASDEASATTRAGRRLPAPQSVEAPSDGGGAVIVVSFGSQIPTADPEPEAGDFTLTADGVEVPVKWVQPCWDRAGETCSTRSGNSYGHQSTKLRLTTALYSESKNLWGDGIRIRQGQTVRLTYAWPEAGEDFDEVSVTNNSTFAPTVPGRPRNVEAQARGAGRIDVNWAAPGDNGGRAISGYRVEASPNGSSSWSTLVSNTGSTNTRWSHTGLSAGTTRHYRISAINSEGRGSHSYDYGHLPSNERRDAIEDASATTAADSRPPELVAAIVSSSGDSVWVEYDEHLWQAPDGLPRAAAFTVRAGGVTVPVERVRRRPLTSWVAVELVLEGAIAEGRSVTLSYADPTAGNDGRALQDGAGNDAASFTDYAVRNGSTVPGSEAQFAPPVTAALTVSVKSQPVHHDGENAFTVRLKFSEALKNRKLGHKVVRVTNGANNGSTRVAGDDELWDIAVEPDGNDAVTIALAASETCGSGIACTKGDHRPLSAGLEVTVPGPQPAVTPGLLTGWFLDIPSEHDGTVFPVHIGFSEKLKNKKLGAKVVKVTGGANTGSTRLAGDDEVWTVTVEPDGNADITIALAASETCGSGIVCTKEGRHPLSAGFSQTVKGPAGLSVADARATEAAGATVEFTVTLSRKAIGAVTVEYETGDGSAKAGEDFTNTSGTLTFLPNQDTKTVSVPIIDDAVDEGDETFTLTLSNATNAYILDGTATGTIGNDDPLQRAWLARLGRTVGSQAVEAVGARLSGGGGTQVTVGGQALALGGTAPRATADAEAEAGLERMTRWLRHADEEEAPSHAMEMEGRELLLASSFNVAGGEAGALGWGAWGRFATGSFEGEDGGVTLSGDVTTAFLGADVDGGRWLAGLAVGHSEGEGPFRLTGDAASNRGRGTIESTLTALYPYGRLSAGERLELWAMGGFGQGSMTIAEEEGAPLETDIGMRMGAAGAKGALFEAPPEGGLALGMRGDVLWVRMESDARSGDAAEGGNLAAAEADVTRLRLILDASRAFALDAEATLTPSLEAGFRHDGGDAETGTGVELGGRIAYAAGSVAVEAALRGLVAHEDEGYEEWGASASLRIEPGASGRGFSLKLAPTWGASGSATGHLWGAADARSFAPDAEFEAGRRLEAEAGYGLGLGRGVLTPFAGLSLSDGGARVWRTGARWALGPSLNLALEGTRREAANDAGPEHRLGLTFGARW